MRLSKNLAKTRTFFQRDGFSFETTSHKRMTTNKNMLIYRLGGGGGGGGHNVPSFVMVRMGVKEN